MHLFRRTLAFFVLLLSAAVLPAQIQPEWTTPLPPFQIADNLYYVGSQDLGVFLITTPKGNILINANLETSPPQIRASVEKLGFRWTDIKILLNGQAHYDHMAGAAEILRKTHAKNMVMDGDVDVVESGGRKDFLIATKSIQTYPPAHVDRILHDGDTVSLGGVTLTAHKTAGHTRGCTTWTFRTHMQGDPSTMLRNVVIVGGLTFWSDFQFVARPGHPESYPGIAADFAQTFRTMHALPCDIFLGEHGGYFDLMKKYPRLGAEGPKVFIDPTGYAALVNASQAKFEAALAKQQEEAAAIH